MPSPRLDISKATKSDMATYVSNISVDSMTPDTATGEKETEWQNPDWATQWGYFNSIPELKAALITKTIWICGKGYTCDTRTKVILDHVSGWGKDSFQDVLFNQILISRLAGDSFAEIIRDPDSGTLLNLKPLDPGSMKIIVDAKGIIKRYEQVSLTKEPNKKFEPNRIFHLSHNRLASQIHGISDITSMEQTILAELESFTDMKRYMHLASRPFVIIKIKSDNQTKINNFLTTMAQALNNGEFLAIPDDEDIVSYEVIQATPNQSVFEWRRDIRNKFYRALGMPQSIFGSSETSESQGKIEYLGHEQIWAYDQEHIELQIWNQLHLKIKMVAPVSLLPNIQTDQSKDAAQGFEIQPNDMTAGSGE